MHGNHQNPNYASPYLQQITPEKLSVLEEIGAFGVHNIYNQIRNRTIDEYYYTIDGSKSEEIEALFDKAINFWDSLHGSNLLLIGAHSQQLRDPAVIAESYNYAAFAQEAFHSFHEILEAAKHTHDVIDNSIGFDSPLLTLTRGSGAIDGASNLYRTHSHTVE